MTNTQFAEMMRVLRSIRNALPAARDEIADTAERVVENVATTEVPVSLSSTPGTSPAVRKHRGRRS